jgi:type II secretory pathway predicted ATPase ExeA
MHAAEHLKMQTNPFTANASGARLGRPLQAALGEVIRQIGLEAPVVVVCGNAGAGKTLLINMIARSCTDMGLCARQIDRGDLMHAAFGQRADVLLIDEADSITESTLHTLISAGANTSTTTMVFLCLPSNARRFTSSGGRAVIIELAPLMHADARNYLLERATSAGRPDLFDADALDLLIDGARGSPRVLRSIASLSFFAAAVDGSTRIARKHVADALASQIHCETPKSDQTPIPSTPRAEIPILAPVMVAPFKAPPTPRVEIPILAPVMVAPFKAPPTPRVEIPILAPAMAAPFKAPTPAPAPVLPPAPALEEPASEPELESFGSVAAETRKKFGVARSQSAAWIPRLVGISAALVASVAIAEGLPSRLFSSIPTSANALNGPPAGTQAVPRLGFASFVPRPPATPPASAPNKAEAAKQTADIAKALKDAAAKETKSVASAVPARRPPVEQAQATKKPSVKDTSGASEQTKAAMEEAARERNRLAAKEVADRAAALAALNVVTAPPAPVQELAAPAPAPKEVTASIEPPKRVEAPVPSPQIPAAQAPAPQIMAVLPPTDKQKEAEERAKAEELALARGREAVLAKVAADRALAAKEAEERAWAVQQATNREAMRALANSLRGLRN